MTLGNSREAPFQTKDLEFVCTFLQVGEYVVLTIARSA